MYHSEKTNPPELEESAKKANIEKFRQIVKDIQDLLNLPGSKSIINRIRNEDIAMFIGNTKSGKSTLVNHAIGNQLRAVKKSVYPRTFSIAKICVDDAGPAIGFESISETTLPTVWSSSRSEFREKIVDAPGFEDNRGEAQDIANSFYIREIIRNAKSVKFVLISDIADINGDNIAQFTNFTEKITTIFPDPLVLKGGMMLVFSKGPIDETSEPICEMFTAAILNQEKMKITSKPIIKYFTLNQEAITFFPSPLTEGNINELNIGQGLLAVNNRIVGIPRADLYNVKPGISDKSRVLLLQLHTEFCNNAEFISILYNIRMSFMRNCLKINDIDSIEEIQKIDQTFEDQHKEVVDMILLGKGELNLIQLFSKVVELGLSCGITNIADDSNIELKLQFVEFVDDTLGLNNSGLFRIEFFSNLEVIRNELMQARLKTATRMNKITAEQAERDKMALQEQHFEEMKMHREEFQKVEFENLQKVIKQLDEMGIVDHLFEAGKKLGSQVTGWFASMKNKI